MTAPVGRLPGRFHLLFSASLISNVGDGLAFTAFPLLAASLTRDPLSISLVTAAGTLPFAVLALLGGVLVDRLDRRRIMVVTDGIRALVVAGLVACVVDGDVRVASLAAFAAAIGVGACLFTIGSQALVPEILGGVERVQLARANGRLFGSEVFGVQLAGPAAGGALFAVAHHLPFSLDAGSFALSALLVGLLPGRYRATSTDQRPPPVHDAIRAGVRVVARSRSLRSFTLAIAGVNLAVAAQEAVLVVLAERRLGLGATGYGLLFATLAVGGLLATALGGPMARRWHDAVVLRIGFGLLPLGALLTGIAPVAAVCGVGLALTSFGLMTINVAAGPLRQTMVPADMLGRVYAASTLLGRVALPVGAVAGGALASADPRLPFLVGAGFLAVTVVAALPGLTRRVIDRERAAAAPPSGPSGSAGSGRARVEPAS